MVMHVLNVADPSKADVADTHQMNMAATDANRTPLHGGGRTATDAPTPTTARRVDAAEAQKVAQDLEALKDQKREVSAIFNTLMRYVEGEGPDEHPLDEAMAEEGRESTLGNTDAAALTSICANTKILHPLQKLQIFAWLIRSKGVQVDNLSRLLNNAKGDDALWLILPALINTSMDIIVKLCCTWSVYASLFDLEALSSKEPGGECLLNSAHPSVRHTVTYVNNLIKSRRDMVVHAHSAASAHASNETHRSIKNKRSIMGALLADVVSPLLIAMDATLRSHLMS